MKWLCQYVSFVIIVLSMSAKTKAESHQNILAMEMRIRAEHNVGSTVLFKVKNITQQTIEVDEWNVRGNAAGIKSLAEYERNWRWGSLSVRPVPGMHIPMIMIGPGESHQWEIRMDDPFYHREHSVYEAHAWRIRVILNQIMLFTSQKVFFGFLDENRRILSPVVSSTATTTKPILAFLFCKHDAPELAFLVLNGSKETVTVEKPLTQTSRIVASAPAIKYTRELFITEQAAEVIEIEAGKVGEWRIPWQTVYELIPEEDLEKIKAAGGDLDLVWKVGDYQSDPLPLSLAEPVGVGEVVE